MRTYLIALPIGLALAACSIPEAQPSAATRGGYIYAPSGAGSMARGGSVVSRQAVDDSKDPGAVLR